MFDKEKDFEAYLQAQKKRFGIGAVEYGDRSYSLDTDQLIKEIEEEIFDIPVWLYFLKHRVDRLKWAIQKLENNLDKRNESN